MSSLLLTLWGRNSVSLCFLLDRGFGVDRLCCCCWCSMAAVSGVRLALRSHSFSTSSSVRSSGVFLNSTASVCSASPILFLPSFANQCNSCPAVIFAAPTCGINHLLSCQSVASAVRLVIGLHLNGSVYVVSEASKYRRNV